MANELDVATIEQPLVSVIVPVYRTALQLLRECIWSIANQQTKIPYEIVIVDDGNDDDYVSALSDIMTSFSRIRLLSIRAGGVSRARNYGVRNSAGKYVTFVDADDVLSPYFIEDCIDAIISTGADYVVGLVEHIPSSGVARRFDSFSPAIHSQVHNTTSTQLLRSFFLEGTDGSGPGRLRSCPVGRIISREVAEAHPFDESFGLGEDTLFNIDVLNSCECVCEILNTYYLYRENETSKTHSFEPSREADVVRLLNSISEKICAYGYDLKVEQDALTICWLVFLCTSFYFHPDNSQSGSAALKHAMRREPWKSHLTVQGARVLPLRYKVFVVAIKLRAFALLRVALYLHSHAERRLDGAANS